MLALQCRAIMARRGAQHCACDIRRCYAAIATPDASHVDARNAPSDFDPSSAVVYSEFITKSEGESMVKDIFTRMKRYGLDNK